MVRSGRWGGVLGRHALTVDCVLGLVVAVVTVAAPQPDALPGQIIPVAAAVAGAVAALALAGRRIWPRASFAVVAVATAAAIVLSHGAPLWTIAEPVGLYTVAVRTERRTTVRAFGLSVLVLVAAVALASLDQGTQFFVDAATGQVTLSVVAAAVGDAVRSRRAYLAATEERADRAEQTREEEARRQVVEERLRIARELHDVVAHHVSVVSIQTGLAAHLIFKQPAAAQQALEQAQQASATILDELAGILGVLRHPDDQEESAPAPGLQQLDKLVGSYTAAGLAVQLSRAGRPHPLGGNADLVAYRLVQEALTNAHKHGGPLARVSVTYSAADLVVEIANPLREPHQQRLGTGHGLVGMRERAAAVGGSLLVEPDAAGEFQVRLTLPVPVLVV